MSLITGSVYLAGSLLSFALPVGLLISFATFFVRQARKNSAAAPGAGSTPSAANTPSAATSAGTAGVGAPEPPAAPGRPADL
jgi:hypothetical protein